MVLEGRVRLGYGLASLVLSGLYPVLPELWRGIDVLVVSAGAGACVAYGRRGVPHRHRRPWSLLLWALVVIVGANLLAIVPDERVVAAGWLVDAAGNLILLAAALSLIIRRGARDLAGIADAAVIAFAAGSLLWAVLPHRVGADASITAQVDLFVVVFALTGILGALMRLARNSAEVGMALWWLLAAIGLAICGNIVLAIGGADPLPQRLGNMFFLGAFTATGLFGLDPTGPTLTRPQTESRPERLTVGRLAFLGVAVAIVPTVIGVREVLAGNPGGLLLAAQGVLVAALVMLRIGLLSAQRDRAERALEHQATHDPLTHLPNRREFVARLEEQLARGRRCTIFFLDLDGFKEINDQYGHDTGDRLLAEAADRLSSCVGAPHTVSRFGGDEFVILLLDSTPAAEENARACILEQLSRPFAQAGGTRLGVSIGVSHSDSERDPETLIRHADRAMYRVKASRHATR